MSISTSYLDYFKVELISSRDVHYEGKIEVKNIKDFNICNVSNIVNYIFHGKSKKPIVTFSMESTIRENLGLEKVSEIKFGKIHGKPDFIYEGYPGEIKTTTKSEIKEVVRIGAYQVGVYASLMNKDLGFLIVGKYKRKNKIGIINNIKIYKVSVIKTIEENLLEEICSKMRW